jgi:deoxyribodipyrimidine photo-lyase
VPTFVYRFTRDLRLEDHAGLAAAANFGEMLPVLIVDNALHARLARSPRRAAFFCRAVAALDASLHERGSRLIVRRGAPGRALRNLARASGAIGIAWSASYHGTGAHHDRALQSDIEEAGLRAVLVHDASAIPPEETAASYSGPGGGYRAFVPYFATWRELSPNSFEQPLLMRFVASDLQSEALPQPAEFGAHDYEIDATPAHANAALAAFLQRDGLHYDAAANVPADDRTSHLSAHLSFGTIAARTVVRAVQARAGDPFLLVEERAALRFFLRSLALRDFFLQLAWHHPWTDEAPLQDKMRDFMLSRSHRSLDAWRSGNTGHPLVDAGIRQLRTTGWMHPRVRAVAASFLCFDLGVDWRVGRDEWEKYLIEDDPALATGNWQWIAGVGADMAQYPRIYNPETQRRRFDPNGTYVQRWVNELAHRPIGTWSAQAGRAQIELPLFSGSVYARPVVDHESEARAFLARYRAHLSS